jgi:hypothetical protein
VANGSIGRYSNLRSRTFGLSHYGFLYLRWGLSWAFSVGRLLARLDEPSPPLTGIDSQARSSLARAQEELEETDANYDRSPADWPRVEAAFQSVADRLAKAGDPCVSTAWLGLARATKYQRGHRDDTLTALVESLYWDRDNADAWSELVDVASAAPHVPTLLA